MKSLNNLGVSEMDTREQRVLSGGVSREDLYYPIGSDNEWLPQLPTPPVSPIPPKTIPVLPIPPVSPVLW